MFGTLVPASPLDDHFIFGLDLFRLVDLLSISVTTRSISPAKLRRISTSVTPVGVARCSFRCRPGILMHRTADYASLSSG
jgi:hypothetical protein